MVDFVNSLAGSLDSELMLALAFLALTTAVTASGIPWVILPISFSSGVLLGGRLGIAVILAGAIIGSQLLFIAVRRGLAGRVRHRLGERLDRYDREISKRGFAYVIGLRLMGAPNLLVSSACALSTLRARTFALATLIGITPTIVLAVTAGTAV